MKSALQRLTDWYAQQCDGQWEHGYGFAIGTLDNPGVRFSVELLGTYLESAIYEEKKVDYDTNDRWMICCRRENKFEGRGAPSRLEDIVEEFLRWADLHRR